MAENVYQKLEDMLPELEYLEKNGVFTREELRIIIKKRTDFEYKLQRKAADKEDFIKYLQYEISVDMLRKRRLQRLGVNTKYSPAEMVLRKRMHSIFQKALRRFCDDIKLWLQYIDFCKKMQSTRSLGRAFAKLLQMHPRKANFWVLAAKHEFEENSNIEAARTLMQQAIKVNPESQLLWREYCRLELLHVDKIRRRKEILSLTDEHDSIDVDNASEEFLNNKTASIVYNKAIEAIPDSVEFRVSFLPVLRLFKNTDQNIEEVYESLHSFQDKPLALAVLARKPLEEAKATHTEANEEAKDELWIKAETECYNRFLNSGKEQPSNQLWELFLRTFLESLTESQTRSQASRRITLILDIFNHAKKEDRITEDMSKAWGECCLALDDTAGAIKCLNSATKTFADSISVWQHYLKLKCTQANWKTMTSEFERCLKAIPEKEEVHIWRFWIDCFLENFPDKADTVLEKALQKPSEIFDYASSVYIDWTREHRGLSSARKLYHRLSAMSLRTLSLDFFRKGLELENLVVNPKTEKLRSLYEKIVDTYGKDNIDVWLDYIRFEMNIQETAPDRMGRIYLRALKMLQDNLVSDFVSRLSLIQAGSV